MKSRKFDYLYVLQGNYGYGHGWEDLTAEEIDTAKPWIAYRAIRQSRKEYRENEGGNYRIVKRRELRQPEPVLSYAERRSLAAHAKHKFNQD